MKITWPLSVYLLLMIAPKFKQKPLWMEMKRGYENIEFLFKYSPKFYTKINYEIEECKNRKILKKTKSIKISKIVQLTEVSCCIDGPILDAFKNKKKYIKTIPEAHKKLVFECPRIVFFILLKLKTFFLGKYSFTYSISNH